MPASMRVFPVLVLAGTAMMAFISACSCPAQQANHAASIQHFIEMGGINDDSASAIHKPKDNAAFSIVFPRFNVYSPVGDLIYHTTDLNKIRRFVDRFPRNIKQLHAIPGTENWSSIASKYHLDDPSTPTTSTGRYILLSLKAEGCHACSIEQEYLNKVADRLSSKHIRQEVLVLSP